MKKISLSIGVLTVIFAIFANSALAQTLDWSCSFGSKKMSTKFWSGSRTLSKCGEEYRVGRCDIGDGNAIIHRTVDENFTCFLRLGRKARTEAGGFVSFYSTSGEWPGFSNNFNISADCNSNQGPSYHPFAIIMSSSQIFKNNIPATFFAGGTAGDDHEALNCQLRFNFPESAFPKPERKKTKD